MRLGLLLVSFERKLWIQGNACQELQLERKLRLLLLKPRSETRRKKIGSQYRQIQRLRFIIFHDREIIPITSQN